jgi:hypothetical protein
VTVRLVPLQLRLPLLERGEFDVGGPAQLLDLAQLSAYARHVRGLPAAGPLGERGPVQVLIGIGGEHEPQRGVDAAVPVLRGGQ